MQTDMKLVRECNCKKLRQVLRNGKSLTVAQLAAKTEVSVVTVHALLNDFLGSGEVVEIPSAAGQKGRPARCYRLNGAFSLTLVLALYRRKEKNVIDLRLLDLLGTCLAEERQWICPADVPAFLLQLVTDFKQQYPALSLVVFGIPGVCTDGKITRCDCSSLIGWDLGNFPVRTIVENDINAMVYTHAGTDDVCVGMYVPDGDAPGVGICIHGHIFRGFAGLAGEVDALLPDCQWYRPEDRAASLSVLVRAIAFLLNPSRLIVYVQRPDQAEEALFRASLSDRQLGSIEFISSMEEDYLAGLAALGLEEFFR
ncbi:MAG: hypothetical protein LKE40_11220 [Spirochaetia bacterium]|jgi:hypothetical protein|nr:hypothetical protein [Spirochaetia bacterium]